jgi:hypothetical protein
MSDDAAPPPSIDWDLKKFEYDQVKTLFDYTKFHIGLYLTLGGALVAAIGAKTPVVFDAPTMWIAVILIGIAGMAGGIVASSLPEAPTLDGFFQNFTGPWGLQLLKGKWWTHLEHTAFWAGIITAGIAVGYPKGLHFF